MEVVEPRGGRLMTPLPCAPTEGVGIPSVAWPHVWLQAAPLLLAPLASLVLLPLLLAPLLLAPLLLVSVL